MVSSSGELFCSMHFCLVKLGIAIEYMVIFGFVCQSLQFSSPNATNFFQETCSYLELLDSDLI